MGAYRGIRKYMKVYGRIWYMNVSCHVACPVPCPVMSPVLFHVLSSVLKGSPRETQEKSVPGEVPRDIQGSSQGSNAVTGSFVEKDLHRGQGGSHLTPAHFPKAVHNSSSRGIPTRVYCWKTIYGVGLCSIQPQTYLSTPDTAVYVYIYMYMYMYKYMYISKYHLGRTPQNS